MQVNTNLNPNRNYYPGLAENIPAQHIPDLEDRMRPGKMSDSGFLAHNESLLAVCHADKSLLQKLNLSATQVADRLNQLIQKSLAVINQSHERGPTIIEDKFLVTIEDYRGSQRCPFGCTSEEAKSLAYMDVSIEHRTLNEKVKVAGLIVHLIREHGFFEGNVPYRADPQKLAQVLEIEPLKEYPLEVRSVPAYHHIETLDCRYNEESKTIENIMKNLSAEKIEKLGDGTNAFYVTDSSQWRVRNNLNTNRIAQVFIYNQTGEKLPDEKTIFDIDFINLGRLSDVSGLIVLDVISEERAVIGPSDRMQNPNARFEREVESVKFKIELYSKMLEQPDLPGKEFAEKMLAHHQQELACLIAANR